jgi:hypothetical protein
LSQEVDRLLTGVRPQERAALPSSLVGEVDIAQRLHQINERLSPAPVELERRVRAIVQSPSMDTTRTWRSIAWGALTAVAVFLFLWIVLPGGRTVGADMMRSLLGQTMVSLTPTMDGEGETRYVRETLRDLVAAEVLIGRAPSLPRSLPEGYALQEIAAVSYPDLPSWISQPFYVELCYGVSGDPSALRLRQYRLLFRDHGGITGLQVAGDKVVEFEQVEVAGVKGTLLTILRGQESYQETYTVLWERDGLLLELETDSLSRDALLGVARSVR